MKGRNTPKRKSAVRWGIAAPFLGIAAWVAGAQTGPIYLPQIYNALCSKTKCEVVDFTKPVPDYNCAGIDSNPVKTNSSNLDAVVRDANGVPNYVFLDYNVPTEEESRKASNTSDLEYVVRDANSVAEPNEPKTVTREPNQPNEQKKVEKTEVKEEIKTKPLIVIDPGHGMNNKKPGLNDPGCVSGSVYERDVVSKIANMTAVFCQQMGFDVQMTRYDNETGMNINDRARFIDEKNPAAALILHADSADEKARGPTGIYKPGSSKETQSVALEESILAELKTIDPDYAAAAESKGRGIKTEIDASGHTLGVLDANEVTAYMELGFLTNPPDRAILIDKAYEVAQTLAVGAAKDILARHPELKGKIKTEIKSPNFSYLEVYRQGAEVLTNMLNVAHKQKVDPNYFLARIHVEAGSKRERENSFKYDPMQIANARGKGNSLLEVLASGAENSDLIWDFSPLQGKTKARWDKDKKQWDYSDTGMTADISLLGGIGGTFYKAAKFGERTAETGELKECSIIAGDSPTKIAKIAKRVGTTVGILREYNKMDETNLQIGATLKYRKATTEKYVSGFDWERIDRKYNGGGDPLYGAKMEITLRQLRDFKNSKN